MELLRYCCAERIGVVPQGGNTSYCGGATPHAGNSEIVVSLRRMRRILSIDPANDSMTAEAGCVLADLQHAALAANRLLPMSLGSEGSCTLRGIISTNAGGTSVLRYGMMRALVLGLEVVLPDGRRLDQLGALRKDNTGYDVKQLFIGAEGTLGVITAACLKLFPRPGAHATAFVALSSPQAAVDLLARLRTALGDSVTSFELMPHAALELVCRHIEGARDPFATTHAWYALLEASLPAADYVPGAALEPALDGCMTSGLVADAVIAGSLRQREELWRLRESVDIDYWELNEAFAAQAICCIKELGIDSAKVNHNGGAISIGHPIGASGARIFVTLLYQMQRINARRGLATLCIGGGMGRSYHRAIGHGNHCSVLFNP